MGDAKMRLPLQAMSSARDHILAKIRQALASPGQYKPPVPDLAAQLYTQPTEEDPVVEFAFNFESKNGQLHYVQDPADFFDIVAEWVAQRHIKHIFCQDDQLIEWLDAAGLTAEQADRDIIAAEVGITKAEALVMRTGSILVSSRQGGGRRGSIYPPIHAVVAFASQVVPDIAHALELVQQAYGKDLPSMISLTTGPSRTADIEKTLVMGAHGPKELHLFLIDDLAQLPPTGTYPEEGQADDGPDTLPEPLT